MDDPGPPLVTASIAFPEIIGALQGEWYKALNGVGVTVDGTSVTFSSHPGEVHEIKTEGNLLILNKWTMMEMLGPEVVWSKADRYVSWTRPDVEEPPQKMQKVHATPLTSRMAWGDPALAEFTDAQVIAVNGRIFAVHRAVLAAASPVFRLAFSSQMREGLEMQIEITDAPAVAVEAFLHFIYTGELRSTSREAIAVLRLAHRYELMDLFIACTSCMLKDLSVDNIVGFIAALQPFVDCNECAKRAWSRLQQAARRDPKLLDKVFFSVRSSENESLQ